MKNEGEHTTALTIQNLPIFTESMGLPERMATDVGSWWMSRVKSVGVTQKHAPAHLQINCKVFEKMDGKQDAYKAAVVYSKKGFTIRDSRMRYCLILCGSVGTGKTWLGTAAFKHRLFNMDLQGLKRGKTSACWRTFSGMIRHIQSSYSQKDVSSESIIASYQQCELLYIDDFGDMEGGSTEDKRSIMFEIMDYRNSNSKSTIMTTNLELGEMREKWGERLFDRIAEMSSIVTMSGKNMRHIDMGRIDFINDVENMFAITPESNVGRIPVYYGYPGDHSIQQESEEYPF